MNSPKNFRGDNHPLDRVFVNGTTIFASISSYLYMSRDSGITWKIVDSSSNARGAIRTTGDVLFTSGNPVSATGVALPGQIYRSIDKGETWQICYRVSEKPIDGGQYLLNIADVNGEKVFATVGQKIIMSSDKGLTWQQISNMFPENLGNILDLNFLGTTMFMAISNNLAAYRSLDNGQRWTPLSLNLPNNVSYYSSFFIDGNSAYIYVSMAQSGFTSKFVGAFRSDDNGTSWLPFKTNLGPSGTVKQILKIGSAMYIHMSEGGNSSWGRVFRSTNNGSTFDAINDGLQDGKVLALTSNGSTLYAGTDKGLFVAYTNLNEQLLTVSSSTLTLGTFPAGTASPTLRYSLTGRGLTNGVNITASNGIQLSVSSSGTWSSSLTLTPVGGNISQTIYVRALSFTQGAFSGTVTHSSGTAPVASVNVTGFIAAPLPPQLTATPTTLQFPQTAPGVPSSFLRYTLTGQNLTAPVTVTAPAGVELISSSGDWVKSLTFTPDNGSVSLSLAARINSSTPGDISGAITHVSGSVSASVAVRGSVAQSGRKYMNPADSLELVKFFNATGGANWKNKTGWLTNQPANTWYGVQTICRAVSNSSNDTVCFVSTISLPNNNLTSNNLTLRFPELQILEISNQGQSFKGSIQVDAPKLNSFSASDNNLSEIFPFNSQSLQNLNLSNNSLTSVPDVTLNLQQPVKNIDVKGNYLTYDFFEKLTIKAKVDFTKFRSTQEQKRRLLELDSVSSKKINVGTFTQMNWEFLYRYYFSKYNCNFTKYTCVYNVRGCVPCSPGNPYIDNYFTVRTSTSTVNLGITFQYVDSYYDDFSGNYNPKEVINRTITVQPERMYLTMTNPICKIPSSIRADVYQQTKDTTRKDTTKTPTDSTKRKQVYTIQCGGIGTYAFDVGAGNKWQDGGASGITWNGTMSINTYLKFSGSMQIDTLENVVTASGNWFVNTKIRGAATQVPLYDGSITLQSQCPSGSSKSGFWKALSKSVEFITSKFGGTKLKLEELEFTSSSDPTKANGLKIKITLESNGIFPGGCNPDPTAKTKQGLTIGPIALTEDAVSWTTSVDNFSLGPLYCLKQASVTYDAMKDSLGIGGTLGTPFGEFGASGAVQNGLLNSVGINVEATRAVPVWGTPPLALKQVRGQYEGFALPPKKLSLGGTLTDPASADLYEADIDLSTTEFGESLEGKATVRLVKRLNAWQGELAGTVSLNPKTPMKVTGSIKLGSFDAMNYVINGSGDFAIGGSPGVYGTAKGSLTVPNLKSGFPFDWINAKLGLPKTIGEGEMTVRNTLILGYVSAPLLNVDKLPFSMYLNDWNTLKLEGLTNSNGSLSGLAVLPSVNPYQIEGQSIALAEPFQKGASQLTADKTTNIPVTTAMSAVFVRISSKTKVPSSYLMSPQGTRINGTNADSTITYAVSQDSLKAFWTLSAPAAGTWKLVTVNPASTDSLDVFSLQKPRDFSIQSSQNGKQVTVSWDASKASDIATVDVFLDDDNKDFNGKLIGSVREKAGSFTYTLNDTLPQCAYNVYAIRNDNNVTARAYSAQSLTNTKASIPPPMKPEWYVYLDSSVAVVRWKPVASPNVSGYKVVVTDELGRDSIHASLYNFEDSVLVIVPEAAKKKYAVVPFGAIGQGCPIAASRTESVFTITSVREEKEVTKGAAIPPGTVSLTAHPNPFDATTTIEYGVSHDGRVRIEVFSLLGQKLITLFDGAARAGTYTLPLDMNIFPSGMYLIQMQSDTGAKTLPVHLIH